MQKCIGSLLNDTSNHANWRIPGNTEGTASLDEAELSDSFCIVQEKTWIPETVGTFCLPFKQSLSRSIGAGRSELPVTRPDSSNKKNKTSHCDAETFQSFSGIKHFTLISSTLPQVCQMQGVSYLASLWHLSKKQVTRSNDHYFRLRGCFFVHSSSILTLLSLNWQFILYVSQVLRQPWWNNTRPADSLWVSSPSPMSL